MNILQQLEEHRYALLFPLSIIEGPVVAIVSGMLSNSGVLNLKWACPIVVLGDIIGDSVWAGPVTVSNLSTESSEKENPGRKIRPNQCVNPRACPPTDRPRL